MKSENPASRVFEALEESIDRAKRQQTSWLALAITIVFFATIPLVLGHTLFFGTVLVFSIFALGYNLLVGFSGPLSFGHAPFYGAGAYIGVFAIQDFNLSLIPTVLLVFVIVGIASAIMGIIALQRHGLYFAMITLGLGQVGWALVYFSQFTGATDGLRLPGRDVSVLLVFNVDFSNTLVAYYAVFVAFVIVLFGIRRLINSPFGLVLKSIRENRERSSFVGYNTTLCLWYSFILSALISSIAGLMKVLLLGTASPGDLYWETTGNVLLMTLLGGLGTILGPVVGAAVFLSLEELLIGFTNNFLLFFGLLLIPVILFMPQGIVGWLQSKMPQGIVGWLQSKMN